MGNYIALIPARGGSKGLPKKNILDLHGLPLIAWSILFAKATEKFTKILVSTDCKEIAKIAEDFGAEVPFIRSAELANDTTKTSDVVLDTIKNCQLRSTDNIILLEPTSPYRTKSDFEKLVSLIEYNQVKKVMSVSEAISSSYEFQYFLDLKGKAKMVPVLDKDKYSTSRRQDISTSYFLDGTFYASRVDSFIDNPTFLDSNTFPLIVNQLCQYEIDSLLDLKLYQAIFSFFGAPSWYCAQI